MGNPISDIVKVATLGLVDLDEPVEAAQAQAQRNAQATIDQAAQNEALNRERFVYAQYLMNPQIGRSNVASQQIMRELGLPQSAFGHGYGPRYQNYGEMTPAGSVSQQMAGPLDRDFNSRLDPGGVLGEARPPAPPRNTTPAAPPAAPASTQTMGEYIQAIWETDPRRAEQMAKEFMENGGDWSDPAPNSAPAATGGPQQVQPGRVAYKTMVSPQNVAYGRSGDPGGITGGSRAPASSEDPNNLTQGREGWIGANGTFQPGVRPQYGPSMANIGTAPRIDIDWNAAPEMQAGAGTPSSGGQLEYLNQIDPDAARQLMGDYFERDPNETQYERLTGELEQTPDYLSRNRDYLTDPGDAYMQTPAYQAMMDESLRAAGQSATASGATTYGGRRLKAAGEVGAGVQQSFYNNYMGQRERAYENQIGREASAFHNQQAAKQSYYNNYMGMLQNMASPATSTNLAGMAMNQGAMIGSQNMSAQQMASGYQSQAAQIPVDQMADQFGMIAGVGSAMLGAPRAPSNPGVYI